MSNSKVIFKGKLIEEKNGMIFIDGKRGSYSSFKPVLFGLLIGWLVILSIVLMV